LAHDWTTFLARAIPEATWLPIPNLGHAAVDYAVTWGVDGFVLTGGNDVGSVAIRDQTELSILAHAVAERLPVFGVCRGLQLLQHRSGGALRGCPVAEHVARTHSVRFTDALSIDELRGSERLVNSFHRFGVRREELAVGLLATAVTADGWVEALRTEDGNVQAVMWHPERCQPFHEADFRLVRRVFGRAAA
jgi:N5-(cytidine 5'-diphosphoramidyl)-L-glutamine hydrolase